jgi:hypothetical protein
MEKNTKILLGIGAVIAAYLILKPKKEVVKNPIDLLPNSDSGVGIVQNPEEKEKFFPNESQLNNRLTCPQGYVLGTKVVGGVVGILPMCKDINGKYVEPIPNPNYVEPTQQEIEQIELQKLIETFSLRQKNNPLGGGNCNCFRAPCNCGGGGVKLDTFMLPQLS